MMSPVGTVRVPQALHALLADAHRCAEVAGLTYVERTAPGITRRRCGRGFRYLDVRGRPVDATTRARIERLAIPPAWRDVWICTDDGHLLATGADDRGRTQYLYHDRWRELRDLINFYRLTEVGRALPLVRADIDTQLRRRTIDRAHVIATMLRLAGDLGLRVGNEVYAEENDTVGLCTMQKRHVRLDGRCIELRFRAKSGKRTELSIEGAPVARVIRALETQPGRRLFSIDRSPVTADEVNARLAELTGGVMTAKDFRTWHGTLVAFRALRRHRDAEDREGQVVAALDATAAALGNTRAVARAHYVHPHLIDTYRDGTFGERLAALRPTRRKGLETDERDLLGYLDALLRDYSPRLE